MNFKPSLITGSLLDVVYLPPHDCRVSSWYVFDLLSNLIRDLGVIIDPVLSKEIYWSLYLVIFTFLICLKSSLSTPIPWLVNQMGIIYCFGLFS